MARPAPLILQDATHVKSSRGPLVYFGGCNYLNLAGHPIVMRAMQAELRKDSPSAGASRATTGEKAVYLEAEKALAEFFDFESAALVAAGYLAPIAAAQALEISNILLDDAAHPAVADAARLFGGSASSFPHGDSGELARKVRLLGPKSTPCVACEGLLGARGRLTPVRDYAKVLPRSGWLLIDDAHGAGTLGSKGGGIAEGLDRNRLVVTLSLSKAFGLQGGAVLGPRALIDRLKTCAGAFVGNTAPLPHLIAGLLAALRLLRKSPKRIQTLQAHARALHERMGSLPKVIHDRLSPVLTVWPADEAEKARLCEILEARRIFPTHIRYFSGSGFFRFALNAAHTSGEVRRLALALRDWSK